MHRPPDAHRALTAALLAASGMLAGCPAHAQFFQNSTGLSNPGSTVAFNETPNSPVSQDGPVTTQFSNYGVTFSNVLYDPVPGMSAIGNGTDLGNFIPNQAATNPFSVFFNAPVTQADVYIQTRTDSGTAEIDAYLNGTQVGTQTVNRSAFAAGPFAGYSFSPASGKTFNELRLSILTGGDNAAIIDEVQFTPAPEPSQTAALGVGLLGLSSLLLRARKRRTA